MADFDFRTRMQAPNFQIPPEVIALLSDAIQKKNQMYQSLGQDIGKFGSGALEGYQQAKQKRELQQNQQELAAQNPALASVSKFITPQNAGEFSGLMKPQKPTAEYSVVGGELSPKGEPLIIDKFSGEIRPSGPAGTKVTSYGATMAPIRKSQYTLQDLPSNQPPSTAGGAAYQVKVAARQGKSIIAKPGSPQRTGLAAGDQARAILRAAPTEETMKAANFSDNLITRWAFIKQKITADPQTVNNPEIRREIYNIFDELDKSATPWIQNQLDYMDEVGFPVSQKIRRKQLGLDIPDVPFIETTQPTQPSQSLGAGNGLTPQEQQEYQRLHAKYGNP